MNYSLTGVRFDRKLFFAFINFVYFPAFRVASSNVEQCNGRRFSRSKHNWCINYLRNSQHGFGGLEKLLLMEI